MGFLADAESMTTQPDTRPNPCVNGTRSPPSSSCRGCRCSRRSVDPRWDFDDHEPPPWNEPRRIVSTRTTIKLLGHPVRVTENLTACAAKHKNFQFATFSERSDPTAVADPAARQCGHRSSARRVIAAGVISWTTPPDRRHRLSVRICNAQRRFHRLGRSVGTKPHTLVAGADPSRWVHPSSVAATNRRSSHQRGRRTALRPGRPLSRTTKSPGGSSLVVGQYV